jgi:hypothetical protein
MASMDYRPSWRTVAAAVLVPLGLFLGYVAASDGPDTPAGWKTRVFVASCAFMSLSGAFILVAKDVWVDGKPLGEWKKPGA